MTEQQKAALGEAYRLVASGAALLRVIDINQHPESLLDALGGVERLLDLASTKIDDLT